MHLFMCQSDVFDMLENVKLVWYGLKYLKGKCIIYSCNLLRYIVSVQIDTVMCHERSD